MCCFSPGHDKIQSQVKVMMNHGGEGVKFRHKEAHFLMVRGPAEGENLWRVRWNHSDAVLPAPRGRIR